MTARYGTKPCAECGTEFARSRTDYTTRCPACREARRPKAPTTSEYTATKAMEAKMAAYAARRAGDREAEAKFTAEYLHYAGRR